MVPPNIYNVYPPRIHDSHTMCVSILLTCQSVHGIVRQSVRHKKDVHFVKIYSVC